MASAYGYLFENLALAFGALAALTFAVGAALLVGARAGRSARDVVARRGVAGTALVAAAVAVAALDLWVDVNVTPLPLTPLVGSLAFAAVLVAVAAKARCARAGRGLDDVQRQTVRKGALLAVALVGLSALSLVAFVALALERWTLVLVAFAAASVAYAFFALRLRRAQARAAAAFPPGMTLEQGMAHLERRIREAESAHARGAPRAPDDLFTLPPSAFEPEADPPRG